MDCGVPFCHNGCPLGNLIPDWNDLVYRGRLQGRHRQLHATNNFPEFTGRLCPPLRGGLCARDREGEAVTIEQIENAIINRAFQEGWVVPEPPRAETVRPSPSSAPAPPEWPPPSSCAAPGTPSPCSSATSRSGGLIRFGVPDFKIEKTVVSGASSSSSPRASSSAAASMSAADVSAEELRRSFDAVVLATGSRVPRDLSIPGRELDGVHFAMDYLYQRNRWIAREFGPAPITEQPPIEHEISAKDRDVVVIGGGDTGADCVGNALREGARSVTQLELLSEPPAQRPDDRTPWPLWPAKYRLSYAMDEARTVGLGEQDYSVATTRFEGDGGGAVVALHVAEAQPEPPFAPVPGTEYEIRAQLVLLAMGFLHPEQGLLESLGVARDERGNVKAVTPYTTSVDGIFAAGDARRGQSLIVWAINEGRQCARVVDRFLAGRRNGSIAVGPGARSGAGDEGLAGHADADEGPEGPPAHAGPGIVAD